MDDPRGAGEFLQALQAKGEIFRYFGFVSPPPAGNGDWQLHEHYMEPDVLPLLANNRAWPLGLDDIQGYDPAHLTIYRDFFIKLNAFERDYHEELVLRLGIRFAAAESAQCALRRRALDLHRFRSNPLSRGFQERSGSGARKSPGIAARLDRPFSPTNHARRDPLICSQAEPSIRKQPLSSTKRRPALARATTTANESAAITEFADDSIKLSVHADSAGLVMLSEIYDPDWSVSVDGEHATVYRADSVLRAVAVTAGDHTVEFRYEPRSLRIGIIVSTIAALLVFAIAVWAALGWLGDAARMRKYSKRDIDDAVRLESVRRGGRAQFPRECRAASDSNGGVSVALI